MQIKQTNWLHTIFSFARALSLSLWIDHSLFLTLVIFLRWSFSLQRRRRRDAAAFILLAFFLCFCTFCLLFPFWSHIYYLVYKCTYICIWYACVCVCECTCITSFTFIEFSFICVYFFCSLWLAVALSVVCFYPRLWVKVCFAPCLLLRSSATIAGEDWRFALTHASYTKWSTHVQNIYITQSHTYIYTYVHIL